MYTGLISVEELRDNLERAGWSIVDCGFDLDATEAGRAAYAAGHIPGAVYAHLDEDLSSSPVTDAGRHPLPSPAAMIDTFERLGISSESQVVVYDRSQGMYACRLWWMLRYLGHEAVAVLDGGFDEWTRRSGPMRPGVESKPRGRFEGSPRREWLVVKEQVMSAGLMVDARDAERYLGAPSTRDPRAGHIPGALNYPWRESLAEDGRFLPPETIREQLTSALRGTPADRAVFYCGSGVSACADLLAAHLAGFDAPRVYVGSWSEWSRDPSLPAATGEEPA